MNANLNRRQLIQAGIATAAFTHFPDTKAKAAVRQNARKQASSRRVYSEPQREVPVVEAADVVVCGAGPAGVAAALAARNGCLPQALRWRKIQSAMQEMCRHARGSKDV